MDQRTPQGPRFDMKCGSMSLEFLRFYLLRYDSARTGWSGGRNEIDTLEKGTLVTSLTTTNLGKTGDLAVSGIAIPQYYSWTPGINDSISPSEKMARIQCLCLRILMQPSPLTPSRLEAFTV